MLETNPRSHIAPRAASGEPSVAGSEECDPIARYIPRLGVGADIALGSPGVDVDEAALKPKKSASKCGGAIWKFAPEKIGLQMRRAIWRILSSSHLIFLEAPFSVWPINIIPKRKSHCSSREGALWASLATRKFQLWHQGGAWD